MSTPASTTTVTVYWRPGCPWCALVRRGLARAGIATIERNIWEDAEAAATVRGVAGGNETVPTVFVGETALVNPSVAAVRTALARASGGASQGSSLGRSPGSRAKDTLGRVRRRLGRHTG